MIDLLALKSQILAEYKARLSPIAAEIRATAISHQEKAKLVNRAISEIHLSLKARFQYESKHDFQQALIVLQYCTSVVSLEYRHSVWPYEYMALSRRVGELWERFCSAAWDYPSRENVQRIDAPAFSDVAAAIRERIRTRLPEGQASKDLLVDVDLLFGLISEINMIEDEVFSIDKIPHVIDFKSGFGSNEKGNTLRLLTVGKAYKLWNHEAKLLFLVRQRQNNNYLNVIRRSGLWEVHCGEEAYNKIGELTGADMTYIRSNIVNFREDLSPELWKDLASHLSDLSSYLEW